MGHPDRCPARLGRKSILDQTWPRYVHHYVLRFYIAQPACDILRCCLMSSAWFSGTCCCVSNSRCSLQSAFVVGLCSLTLGIPEEDAPADSRNWPPPQAFAPPRRQCPSEKERCAALHRPRQKPTLALQMTSSQRLKQLPSGQPGTAHDYSCHFHWAHLEIG